MRCQEVSQGVGSCGPPSVSPASSTARCPACRRRLGTPCLATRMCRPRGLAHVLTCRALPQAARRMSCARSPMAGTSRCLPPPLGWVGARPSRSCVPQVSGAAPHRRVAGAGYSCGSAALDAGCLVDHAASAGCIAPLQRPLPSCPPHTWAARPAAGAITGSSGGTGSSITSSQVISQLRGLKKNKVRVCWGWG